MSCVGGGLTKLRVPLLTKNMAQMVAKKHKFLEELAVYSMCPSADFSFLKRLEHLRSLEIGPEHDEMLAKFNQLENEAKLELVEANRYGLIRLLEMGQL